MVWRGGAVDSAYDLADGRLKDWVDRASLLLLRRIVRLAALGVHLLVQKAHRPDERAERFSFFQIH